MSRFARVLVAVVALHAGVLWALYDRLPTRTSPALVPVVLVTQFVEPPKPAAAQQKDSKPPADVPQVRKPLGSAVPAPGAASIAQSKAAVAPASRLSEAVNAPTVISKLANERAATTAPEPASASLSAPTSAAGSATAPLLDLGSVSVASAAPNSTLAVQMPSSNADYLQNPSPPYPASSRRLNEQGKTIVRVLIGPDGLPQRSEIAKTSGFRRLDEAAVTTVMRWRYIPGKRGGRPEAMWYDIPINWVLE